MEEEINDLKSVLRSLVVSSPTRMDARSLLRDYRNMVGTQLQTAKFGYTDPIAFLRDRFSDCFLGPSANPELTLIVTPDLKHVDEHVQRQKVSATNKHKVKRRSVPAAILQPSQDLIAATFSNGWSNTKRQVPSARESSEYTDRTDRTAVNHATTKHNGEPQTCPPVSSQQEWQRDRRDSFRDDDSGRLTASSSSSGSKRAQLEELKKEVLDLVMQHPCGLWCTELMKVYSERHGRELNFTRFGYTSILSLAGSVRGVAVTPDAARGDWLLSDAARAPPRPPQPRRLPRAPQRPRLPADPEEALPGIPYAPDVFPEDCLGLTDSIPAVSLADVAVEDLLEVLVGEVYSPSHFWLQRLGDDHNIAVENVMDDMNRYYERGEGKLRRLSPAAVRVGFYCTSRFDGDWHRSLIVRVLDVDTVKVRHVDYGTVERCAVRGLRPLRREFGALPAQALRARLAGVRPVAAARRWPRAACFHFLNLVKEKHLVARVTALDSQVDMLEVLLIDTSTDKDRCITTELINAEQADPRPDPALGTSECYLYPLFEALESGATPNLAELDVYSRDGIQLDCVDDYRLHVPPCLPPAHEQCTLDHRVPTLMPFLLNLADSSRSCSPFDTPQTQATCNSRDAAQTPVSYKSCVTLAQASHNHRETPLTPESRDPCGTPRTHASHDRSDTPRSRVAPSTSAAADDGVWLTQSEVLTYSALYRQNPLTAHCYLMGTIIRSSAIVATAGFDPFRQTPPGFRDTNSTS